MDLSQVKKMLADPHVCIRRFLSFLLLLRAVEFEVVKFM